MQIPVVQFKDFLIRQPTRADIPAIVDLINADSIDLLGVSDISLEEYSIEWNEPGLDRAAITRIAATSNGELVAIMEAHCQPAHVRNFIWGRVHPAYRNQGLGTYLMQWAESFISATTDQAPPDVRITIGCGVPSVHPAAPTLLKALGYQHVRSFYSMKIEMAALPPLPIWPAGITVRTMQPEQDAEAAYRAIEEAFKDHWGHVDRPFDEEFPRWRHYVLNDPLFDPSLMFMAMAGDEIAGLSLCWPSITPYPDMGWIGQLGVRRPWRRQGMALALLHHTFGEFYQRGIKQVGLGVDASSLTGATRLYEKAGMHIFRQNDTYEKELRAGQDLTTQSVA